VSQPTRVEPVWVPLKEIININRSAVELTAEQHAIISVGRLLGGYHRAQNHWHYGEDDIVTLAVVLLFGIAEAHGFEQGNKRTGFTAAVMFLALNGYILLAHDSEELGKLVRLVIVGKLSKEAFAEIIRPHISPV
jgi:death-on-curing protein